MNRIILIETPSYKNKDYLKSKYIYNNNLYTFHKLCTKLKSKLSHKFQILLIGFDKNVKKRYIKFNKTKIINDIKSMPMGNIKCNHLSLYADYNKKTTQKNLGYGNKEKALYTIKKIKNKDIGYQRRTIITLYNRAKFHKNQTKDMKDAMRIFKKWIDNNSQIYKFLNRRIVKKYLKLADEYKVSEVSRGVKKAKTSDKGFTEIFLSLKNNNKLKQLPVLKSNPNGLMWYKKRNNFIKAKINQIRKMKLKYFHTSGKYKGLPTKIHIVLIMWAYSPYSHRL